MAELWHKTCWKQPNLPNFRLIFQFLFFWPILIFQKVFLGHFSCSLRKVDLKHVLQCHITIFLGGLTFFTGWPEMPLTCIMFKLNAKNCWKWSQRTYIPNFNVNFVHFGGGKSVQNIIFRLWPLKVKGHFEVTSYLWLIRQWLNNSEHFGAYCNLLSALEQKIWPFNWRKVRKKSWPMVTSKSDPRGQPGRKLCVHVSVMGYYRFTNFRRNRRGSGIFLGDFTWNDPLEKSQNPFLGGIGRTRHVHPWVWTTWAAMCVLWANTHTGYQVLHLMPVST